MKCAYRYNQGKEEDKDDEMKPKRVSLVMIRLVFKNLKARELWSTSFCRSPGEVR